jgi:hypothetical protein
MVDPWLEDDGASCIYNGHRIVVLCRDSLNQLVATEPCREVISVRCTRIFLISERRISERHCSPVAYAGITLARIGQQKYDCNVPLHRGVGSCIKVEVVEVPREPRMIPFSLLLGARDMKTQALLGLLARP